ncbi:DUF6452 family protein [Cytophagaceae bacterium YF14B1]|uniref:DUF6452 family protein n=1 Tax=Xanthocytophaga flava TaxID=3048013 RepID=A0AAE3U5L2_9BACT|nr:DUF6452 family protein [Xanthocytophaga flavus]MDJ1480391.1 DUF6452 family protein [Xanthocytophaga flavus]
MFYIQLKRFLFLGILICGFLSACTESECTVSTDPRLRIRFLVRVARIANGTTTYTQKDTTIRVISVTSPENPSAYPVSQIDTITPTGNIIASLSQIVDSISLVIKWDTARLAANQNETSIFTDTLKIKYKPQPYFVSEGCGFNYKYTDIDIIKQTFTSSPSQQIRTVTVANSTADETLQPNITIIFNNRTE